MPAVRSRQGAAERGAPGRDWLGPQAVSAFPSCVGAVSDCEAGDAVSRDERDGAGRCRFICLPGVPKQYAILEWIAAVCVCPADYAAAACKGDLEVVLVRVVTQAAQHGAVPAGSSVPDGFGETVQQPEEDQDDGQDDQVSHAWPPPSPDSG